MTDSLQERIARALAYDCEGIGVNVPDPDSDLWCTTHDIGMDNDEWCQEIEHATAAVLPIIAAEVRAAQIEAWDRGEAAGYYNTGPRSRNSNPYTEKEADA